MNERVAGAVTYLNLKPPSEHIMEGKSHGREKTRVGTVITNLENILDRDKWADGNGRMARLLMNWLQFEFGLIPSRIFSDDKEEYIKALVATRENDDSSIVRRFMTDTIIAHLNRDISSYLESIGEYTSEVQPKKKVKTRDKIIELLRDSPKHTTRTLAEEIGITPKGVERHLAILKAEGILHRIGPGKGGEWQIIE